MKTFKAEITTVFTEKVAQVEKTFTEKVAQVEERFFKYTFIAVGVILGGVGLMQYVANENGSQPIIIYTTPQQVDVSRQGAVSYVSPSGQSVDQKKQNLKSIVTSSKTENQPFNQNDNDEDSKSKGKTN